MATATKLSVKDFSQATLPGLNGNPDQNGWKLGGVWINGSGSYGTAQEILDAVSEHGVVPSKSGKSFLLGNFTPVNEDTIKLLAKSGVLKQREEMVTLDLNEYL